MAEPSVWPMRHRARLQPCIFQTALGNKRRSWHREKSRAKHMEKKPSGSRRAALRLSNGKGGSAQQALLEKHCPTQRARAKPAGTLPSRASSPHGRRTRAGGRQQAAGSCPGTSGQPGAFGAGRWSQAAPRSLAFPGSIPGRVLGGQPAAGALPQHPAEHPLPLPRGHGDGAGTEESCLETRGAGGCWHWLCSHLPQRLGAAPPRLVPLFKDLLGAKYSRQREKMCSEAKCPLDVLGGGRGTPEARSPPPAPSSWQVLIPGI